MTKTKKLPQAIAALKKYKEQNNLSFHELEKQTGITATTLNLWFNSSVRPTPNSLNAIKQFLNRVNARQFVKQANSDKTYLDSRLVAKWSEKTHKNLLQDIRGYIKNLKEAQAELSTGLKVKPSEKSQYINVFNPDYYFIESTYKHPFTKQELPCYLVTQRGCEMIANKMTGVKGIAFTALYINEFHRLKSEDTQTIEAPQEAPKIEQATLFDHKPQTPSDRDLAYLLNKVADAQNSQSINELAGNLFKIMKLIQVIKDIDK